MLILVACVFVYLSVVREREKEVRKRVREDVNPYRVAGEKDTLYDFVLNNINDKYGDVSRQDIGLLPEVDGMLRQMCKRYLNLDRNNSFKVDFVYRDAPFISNFNNDELQVLMLPYSQYNALIKYILGQGLMYETKGEHFKGQYTIYVKMPIDFTGALYKDAYDYKESGCNVNIASDVRMNDEAYFEPRGLYRTGEGYILPKK